ncbi:3'-5' exonuclease [Roseitalea porphyridii]|uniref:DNA-directed DNA polymerase n=1 Tax=Roseitalea porphyridii TaxID=1852022 RepID=A0A4P6V3G7_9HYPH|nr:3'-5' exonuclease [Roseitalea porphyridii]QBK31314.1 3'-5' exonuclease [Roseitalea porphyridii]
MHWVERLSLRARIALFFALIGSVSVGLLVGAIIWLSQRLGAGAVDHIVVIVGSAAFAITGLIAWVALKFDENLAKPLMAIAADLKTIAHADGKAMRLQSDGEYLGMIAPAAREVSGALIDARARTDAAIEDAIRDAARQKAELEALLRDLHQGLVVCTMTGRVTLYNHRAVEILHVEEFRRDDPGSTEIMIGSLGLGRDFFNIVEQGPFRAALEAFDLDDGANPLPMADQGAVPIVFSTCDGAVTMRGHIALRLNEAGNAPAGFIAVFDDVTAELAAGLERDRVLREAIGDIRAAVDTNAGSDGLRGALARLEAVSGNIIASAWPMADVPAGRLFGAVRKALAGTGVTLATTGDAEFIHADSATLIALLRHLSRALIAHEGAAGLTLAASGTGHARAIRIAARGAGPDAAWLEAHLDANADPSTAFLSGHAILERHRATARIENGAIVIDFPVNTTARPHAERREAERVGARPEFYDFDLFERDTSRDLLDVPLSQLHAVVFDCEMTGLDPRRGDEIVSIAGARVVNGRVLTGEIFDLFVNPGRPIPAASTNIHHITDRMVADAPGVPAALKRFHAFARDQVLVAHNAAFDMAFLAKGEAAAGVRFDNVVLDTVLLAAWLQGTEGELTLDALAERFNVTIAEADRHTARGDALATAHIFAKLIRLLEASGVTTLGDALRISEAQTAIRRRQAAYG